MPISVGDGPVLCAKRCRSLPQMPPTDTETRAQAGPGRSGSGISVRDAGNDRSTMSNCTARTVGKLAAVVQCPTVRVPDSTLDEVRTRGFSILEGFLTSDELRDAQDALALHYPSRDEYF